MAFHGERAVQQEVAPAPARLAVVTAPPEAARSEARRGAPAALTGWLAVAACAAVAVAHALVVGRHYVVGSFDDDANYLLTAAAFTHGLGLTGHLVSGDSVVGAYPPGYPLLLAPIEALGLGFAGARALSVVCLAAVFPLLWVYLGRRGAPPAVRVGVLAVLALDPVPATFGTMVMAETPFLVCLLGWLLLQERWERSPRLLGPTGVVVAALGAELVWLKEAGVGLLAGATAWYLLRRRPGRAAVVVGGVGLSLAPVVAVRLAAGIPLLGARYAQELGSYYGGGLPGRLLHVLPGGLWTWWSFALPATVIPHGSPLPGRGWPGLAVQAAIAVPVATLLVVGFVHAVRRHRDVAVLAVPAYVAETLLWPYVNERRVILVLPVLLGWIGMGALVVHRGARRALLARRARGSSGLPIEPAAVFAVSALAAVALVAQFPRDYLFGLGQDSPRPQGARYERALAELPAPGTLVETDYRYTTALYAGHRTADTAFVGVINHGCTDAEIRRDLAVDDPGYLLLGDVNKPGLIDSPCLLGWATASPQAVRLLSSSRDSCSVFELIGPGTAHPELSNLLAGSTPTADGPLETVPVRPSGPGDHPAPALSTSPVGGIGSFTWSFGGPRLVEQASVGEAGLLQGLSGGVRLQLRRPDGSWETVATAPRAVGDGPGHTPFLLARPAPGTVATAMRVLISGTAPVTVLDVSALGTPR